MNRWTRMAVVTWIPCLAFAARSNAALVNVVVQGQVGFNSMNQGPLANTNAPVGSAIKLTIPVDTSMIWAISTEEGEEGTSYRIQNPDITFEAGASGPVHGRPQIAPPPSIQNSALHFGAGEFSYGVSTPVFLLDIPGVATTNVNFAINGFSGPNPFTSPQIELNLGTISPLNNPPFSSRMLNLFGSGGSLFCNLTSVSFVAVPEPSTLALMAFSAIPMLRRRRR